MQIKIFTVPILGGDDANEEMNHFLASHRIVEVQQALVNVPSISDILGDKLTAFAPDTIGVPYYKHEKVASNKLNKLRVNNPEAFYYWAKVGELLDGKTI